MKQTARVLRALKRHPDGITQVDWLLPNVIDGGQPITRLAARIKDLRDEGYEIVVDGERYGCAVYKFPQAERPSLPEPVVDVPEQVADGALFDMPPANAILGEEAA